MYKAKIYFVGPEHEIKEIQCVNVVVDQSLIVVDHCDLSKEYINRQSVKSIRIWENIEGFDIEGKSSETENEIQQEACSCG